MKCPFCNSNRVFPSKVQGYYHCSSCGAIIRKAIEDDPELTLYKYKTHSIRTKDPDVENLFEKCDSKFGDEKTEVIATVMDRYTDYSLLFGQLFFAVTRKKK